MKCFNNLLRSYKSKLCLNKGLTKIQTRNWYRQKDFCGRVAEPFAARIGHNPKECSAREAVELVQSFNRCYIHGAPATPISLVDALCEYAADKNLRGIELVHIHTVGDAPQVSPKYSKHFRDNSLFIGENVRKSVNNGKADYTPIFLSEMPRLFADPSFALDVSLVQVSPEDKHGYHSLGTSIDCTRAAILSSKYVIGLVNENMPRTIGDGFIHTSHFDRIVRHNFQVNELKPQNLRNAEWIAKHIADDLIPDKACLQAGIGVLPDNVLSALRYHKDLGMHSEMFSDGILPLIESGVLTNKYKSEHPGKVIASFCHGSQKLYSYIHNNPLFFMADVAYTNDQNVISLNDNVHAINSCLEMDITGQICSDSIGTSMYSGVGGQLDFMRGALFSRGGKAIMALNSTTPSGESRIKSILKPGAGVVLTRSHVHYVVTEYGWAKLYGKTLRERAKLLIEIAHPDFREELERDSMERYKQLDLDWSAKLEYYDS